MRDDPTTCADLGIRFPLHEAPAATASDGDGAAPARSMVEGEDRRAWRDLFPAALSAYVFRGAHCGARRADCDVDGGAGARSF